MTVLELRLCGGVEVVRDGHVLPGALFGGRQGRVVLAYLVCERHRAVRREELAELLWPERLPETWTGSLSAVVSRLRRLFGEAGLNGTEVLTASAGSYQLHLPPGTVIDLEALVVSVERAESAASVGDAASARDAAAEAETIAARGFLADASEWVDRQRDIIRGLRVRASLALSVAHLAAGAAARAVEAARAAVDLDPSLEASYRQLMQALAAAGERGEALRVWDRCRIALVEELGVDPSPETEVVYLEILGSDTKPEPPGPVTGELPSGVVTFLLTDIVESSSLWEQDRAAMAEALQRHDDIVGRVVAEHGGSLLKSKLEGDATVSVFARVSGGVTAAIALAEGIEVEQWPGGIGLRVRMALHTGEAFERDGDYFGPALNRAARLRSLAGAGEVILSQTTADLAREHLPEGVALAERGHRELRGLSRGENVSALERRSTPATSLPPPDSAPTAGLDRPPVPAALIGTGGPFVGRAAELDRLGDLWDRAAAGEPRAAFIGGEPGVGKSRLAGELSSRAFEAGGIVLYGRCDEDLAAPLQPFIEAVRTLAAVLGASGLRTVRGIDELGRVVPELGELLTHQATATRADPETERLALFDGVTQLLRTASRSAPVVLVLDDLHWAGKTTLSLLRHLLRGARDARILVVGTYRDTELARSHPLAATLVDLRRDGVADRVSLTGLDSAEVATYLTKVGNTDHALGRELAEVTAGNPYFLIEVLRHVDEAGGRWEPGALPEGVRDATGRRLSRLSDRANDALTVAAVAGTAFDLALVEAVVGAELVDEVADACRAGLLVEEAGAPNRFRFAHALVRQVLLAELVTLKRLRLHRKIAELLESSPVPDAEADTRLADLAYHWFECALSGGAANAVDACRRAADRAVERLAYEEAGDLFAMALQALDAVEGDVDPGDRATLHLARCDALLTAGDVAGARVALDALELVAEGSERLAAWYATYAGQLAVLAEPDRLTEIVRSIGAAASAMRAAGDLIGEAKAHYVHAAALERLGRIGDAERALDDALAAARNGGDRHLQDAVLAEAPAAALWGPSPVTRASGRCLDVVRVLRITEGAPAVEAVALRCQAMLEALRGRTDAARRMIRSATRTVEQLGLTHRRLEADVAAGFVELLDGQPQRAEELLRQAYDGLRDRGLDGEAAQAAAFLGRALLLQGDVDGADAIGVEASGLAGADLKAAIAWRDLRALAAVERGQTDVALDLAREAVDLAEPTDALLLVADARLTLATVLRATGDVVGAEDEARRALEAAEAKGATVLAEQARIALPAPAPSSGPRATTPEADAPAAPRPLTPLDNDATEYFRRVQAAYRDGDLDTLNATLGSSFGIEDRRSVVAVSLDPAQTWASNRFMLERGTTFDRVPVASRGRSLALERWTVHVREPAATESNLVLAEVGPSATDARVIQWDGDALDDAIAALDAAYLAGEASSDVEAFERLRAFVAALDGSDRDDLLGMLGPAFVVRYHDYPHSDDVLDAEQWFDSLRVAGEVFGEGNLELRHLPLLGSRGFVALLAAVGISADGISYDYPFWLDVRMTAAGIRTVDLFSVEKTDQVFARHGTPADRRPAENLAWQNLLQFLEAHDAGDLAGVAATMGDPHTVDDRRSLVGTPLDRHQTIESNRMIFDGGGRFDVDLLATRGDLLSLSRWRVVIADPPAEDKMLILTKASPHGPVIESVLFDVDDVDAALVELDRLHHDGNPPTEQFANEAFRAALRFRDACLTREREAVLESVAPGFERRERRAVVHLDIGEGDALATWDAMMAVDEFAYERTLVATRGDRLALVRDLITFVDGEAGPAEIEVLCVVQVDEEGRLEYNSGLEPSALHEAFDELDTRYVALGGPDLGPYRRAMAAGDWDRFATYFTPSCIVHDHRPSGYDLLDRTAFVAYQRTMRELSSDASLQIHHVVVSSRHASLTVGVGVGDWEGGSWEIPLLSLAVLDRQNRIAELHFYDLADLDEARAHYDRLGRRSVERAFSNRAWATVSAVGAAVNARDGVALDSRFTEDYEDDDRRSGVLLVTTGRPASPYRAVLDLDEAQIERHLLATRGDHLALVETLVRFRDGESGPSEVACLNLLETDSTDRIAHSVDFDLDACVAAYDELDGRALALGIADHVWSLRVAFNNRDWETYRDSVAPTLVLHDHRADGWGTVGRDAFIDLQREMVDLAPDTLMWVDHVRMLNGVGLMHARQTGTHVGGSWERAVVVVFKRDDRNLVELIDIYDVEDLADAMACARRLASAPHQG